MLLVGIIVQAVLIGWAIVVGLVVHRFVPSVSVGTGALLGLVSTGIIFYLTGSSLRRGGDSVESEDENEAEEEPRIVVLPPPSKEMWPHTPRRRRPRKP